MDVQAAAQLPESFAHAPDSHTGGARRGHLKLLFWRYALATILDFYANMTVSGGNADPGCRAFRVPMNIRETLLHGPENRCFRFAREPLKIRGNLPKDTQGPKSVATRLSDVFDAAYRLGDIQRKVVIDAIRRAFER